MDANAAMKSFHARHVGAARTVFAPGGSYERLARAVRSGPVLDVGCGDGPVLELLFARGFEASGLDMSPEEVAAARARVGGRAVVHVGTADRMPFADASQAEVVSHMAFMLMTPIEDVVAEIARVLRPGGRFTATIGAAGGRGEPAKLFFPRLVEAMKGGGLPEFGDKRLHDVAGLAALFARPTWTDFASEDFWSEVRVPAADLCRWFEAAFYPVDMLAPAAKAELFAWIDSERGRLAPDGTMTWAFGMRQFTVTRSAAAARP
jgi:SAM-dependent methyltransferase